MQELLGNRIAGESDPTKKSKLEKFQSFMEQSEKELQSSLAAVRAEMEELNSHSTKLNILPPLERFGDITSRVMIEHSALIRQIAENV
ncbi:MAG: hypothetical protein QE269_00490 [Fimbriimonas sp.]|nr:hypothetical protein [Fimbriimonas sp.]